MPKILMMLAAVALGGCIFLSPSAKNNVDGSNGKVVLKANPDNVYRTAEEVVLKVKVQDKNGNWVISKYLVIIPEGYYIGSGDDQ